MQNYNFQLVRTTISGPKLTLDSLQSLHQNSWNKFNFKTCYFLDVFPMKHLLISRNDIVRIRKSHSLTWLQFAVKKTIWWKKVESYLTLRRLKIWMDRDCGSKKVWKINLLWWGDFYLINYERGNYKYANQGAYTFHKT